LFRSSLPVGWDWWCDVLGVFVLFGVCLSGGVCFGMLRTIVASSYMTYVDSVFWYTKHVHYTLVWI
jgi:hypothetical protein